MGRRLDLTEALIGSKNVTRWHACMGCCITEWNKLVLLNVCIICLQISSLFIGNSYPFLILFRNMLAFHPHVVWNNNICTLERAAETRQISELLHSMPTKYGSWNMYYRNNYRIHGKHKGEALTWILRLVEYLLARNYK